MTVRPHAANRSGGAPRLGRLASAALLLSVSFVLSRVLGLLRNVAIADIFGSSRAVEAYFAAFRIPDTMFMLVSGGALASALVPMFAGLLEEGEEGSAWAVASTVLNTVALALAGLALIALVFAPQIMDVLVQGYPPSERALTVELTRIMLLQPIFLGIAAILMAILQTYHRFALTAIAPLLYNVAVVVGALVFGRSYGVQALAWAVVVGAAVQLVVLLPGLWREALRYFRGRINWSSAEAREVLRLFGPRVVGLAAFQAMLLITLYLAAGLPPGSVAAINYSWPLMMFPVNALGTSAGTAMFPTLARLSAADDLMPVRLAALRSLRLVLFLAVPASVGLIVLRRPIINLLFAHGAWTSRATEQTAFALLFYAMALAPLVGIEVLARVFYARKDTVTPVRIALVAVVLDATLSILFVHLLPRASGQGGLALATAIATTLQISWLAVALDRGLEGIGLSAILRTLRDAAIASVFMALVLYVTLDPLTAILGQHGLGGLITTGLETVLGIGAFALAAYAIGAPELWEVQSFLGRRKEKEGSA